MELKPQFDELQKYSIVVSNTLAGYWRSVLRRKPPIRPDQRQEQERLEYNRIADELAELYLHHSVLSDLRFCYSEPAFLWEGGFFEALHADEKKNTLHSLRPRSTTPDTSGITRPMMPNFLISLLS